MNIVGKNIKRARQEKDFSQEQLAKKLDCLRPVVSSWETGKQNPSSKYLQKLCAIFDKPLSWFYEENHVPVFDMSDLRQTPHAPNTRRSIAGIGIRGEIVFIGAAPSKESQPMSKEPQYYVIKDESFAPFKQGDELEIDFSLAPKDQCTALVELPAGKYTLGRVRIKKGKLTLHTLQGKPLSGTVRGVIVRGNVSLY